MNLTYSNLLGNKHLISFPELKLNFEINPVAFTIFGIEVKWYGVLITFGMILALIYCFKRMEKTFGVDTDRACDAVIGGFIGAVLCARAYYILFNPNVGFEDFFRYRDGGLAIYGGLIGAVVVGGIVAKIRKQKIAPLFDVASLGFLIGQGVGRWGNFTNQEAFGGITELPWGMTSANVILELGSADGVIVTAHPCFLYESLWCFIGFILLHFYSKHRKFDGEIFLLYTVWYGLGRFFIEGLRTDSLMLGKIRTSQGLAMLLVIAAAALWVYFFERTRRRKTPLYVNTSASAELIAETKEKYSAEKKKQAEKKAKRAEKAVKDAKSAVSEAKKAQKDAESAEKSADEAEEALNAMSEDSEEEENNG